MEKNPHASRLRKGRHSQPAGVYLITTVTLNRAGIFADFEAARTLVRILNHPQDRLRYSTLAYVLMPDHLHCLLQLGEQENLSQCVQRVKSLSAKAIRPDLWQKGFHDRAVREEDDLVRIARYVIANPVRAGLVSRVGAYSHWDAIWV